MTNTVFFFNNFHKCQYFLSMYEVNKGNKVVVVNEPSYVNFLRKIIPENEIIIIPKIRVYTPLTPRNMFETIILTLYCRLLCATRYRRRFKGMKKAVFMTGMMAVEQWVVLRYLTKHKLSITQYDCYNDFSITPVPIENFSRFWHFKLKLLELISGLNLSFVRAKVHGFEMPWLIHTYHIAPPSESDLKPWPEIKRKFNFNLDLGVDMGNSLLIIDGPVQEFKIEEQKTLDNLISFFEKKLQIGKKIFFKPHYGTNHTSFDDRKEFLEAITLIDKSFPVELIMDSFPEVYFFTSTSAINKDCNVKKYCLQNLVEFKDSDAKENFYDILRYSLGDEYENISFVQLDKGL